MQFDILPQGSLIILGVATSVLTSPKGGMATPLGVVQTLDAPRPERVTLLSRDHCLGTDLATVQPGRNLLEILLGSVAVYVGAHLVISLRFFDVPIGGAIAPTGRLRS